MLMTESTDEVINDTTDVVEWNDTTDDGNAKLFAKYGIDPDNATTDDLLKIIQRAEKAEKRIVADKKATPKTESIDVMTKADYAMEKFLDKNPELSEYKSEIEKYTKTGGLSLEEAKTLVLNSDKAKQNRDKTNSLGLSDWEVTFTKTSISKEELGKLSQSEYNKVMWDIDSGKVKLK